MADKKTRSTGALVAATAALVAATLAGCNGTELPTTPDTVATGGRESVVSQTFDNVEPGGVRTAIFSVPRIGAIEVTVAWTSETNKVVTVVLGACSEAGHLRSDCRLGGSTERQRENRIRAEGLAGEYQVWLKNEGPGTETIQLTVQTPAAPPAPRPWRSSDPPERRER
jgi:hypothetical protein